MKSGIEESRGGSEMNFHRGLLAETARLNRGAYKRNMSKAQKSERREAPSSAKMDFRRWIKCQ